MARAQGDLSYQWGMAGNVVAWTSGGPESLSDDSYTSLSDEIDLAGLDNALDLLVSARLRTASGSIGSDPYCHLFAAAPADGTSYPDDPDNWQPVGRAIDVPAADTVALFLAVQRGPVVRRRPACQAQARAVQQLREIRCANGVFTKVLRYMRFG